MKSASLLVCVASIILGLELKVAARLIINIDEYGEKITTYHDEPKNQTLLPACSSRTPKNKTYIIFSDVDKKTWYSAKMACESRRMELASVESAEEQKKLETTIKSIGYDAGPFWLGATDLETELGKFNWISHGAREKRLSHNYLHWDPENKSGADYHCLAVYGKDYTAQRRYTWFDMYCGNMYNFICEYYQ